MQLYIFMKITPTKITIKYSRLIGRGSKEIQIKSLTGIQFKPPGFLSHGYIQFVFPGSSEVKTKSMTWQKMKILSCLINTNITIS